jgi:hypothetical protein
MDKNMRKNITSFEIKQKYNAEIEIKKLIKLYNEYT